MARIESREYNLAQQNNIEKLNGDYFLKVLPSNSSGDFIGPENPLNISKVQLRKEIDTTDGTVIYTAFAALTSTTDSAVWQIKRTTISGARISDEFADGNLNFDNSFDDRASLNYS